MKFIFRLSVSIEISTKKIIQNIWILTKKKIKKHVWYKIDLNIFIENEFNILKGVRKVLRT